MRYSIKKNVLGKPNVHLHCPVCDEGLKVSLSKAGTQDVCPSCRSSFVVPGAASGVGGSQFLGARGPDRNNWLPVGWGPGAGLLMTRWNLPIRVEGRASSGR
jgi:hypothetical protein